MEAAKYQEPLALAMQRQQCYIGRMSEQAEAPLAGYTIYDPIDPFENRAGPFFWKQDGDGGHLFALRAEKRHCNTYGVLHGGVMMTMSDLAMAATSKAERSDAYVTVSFNSEFVDSGFEGDIIECSGELVRRTGSMAFIRGRIEAGGRTLFVFSGVMKKLRRPSD
jgi:uncharacterized protein (TIGR00369 family)